MKLKPFKAYVVHCDKPPQKDCPQCKGDINYWLKCACRFSGSEEVSIDETKSLEVIVK